MYTYSQPYVWKELLLAAIGEQFMDFLHDDDEICGLSVSPREKDDLIQIWNLNSKSVQQSRVLEKVHSLVPDVRFNAEFYKRKNFLCIFKKIYVCNPQHFLIKTIFNIFSTSNSFCFWKAKLTVFTKKSQHIHPEPEKKDCLFHRKCVRKCQTSLIHSEEIFFFFKKIQNNTLKNKK